MTIWGWDFSGLKPTVAEAKNAGISLIWIYLHNDWRGFRDNHQGRDYCDAFRAADILVEGVHEARAGDLTTFVGLGRQHGAEASAVASAWGFPDWQRLHAATDIDLRGDQYDERAAYQHEFNSGSGHFCTGYDESGAIDYMAEQGVLAGGTGWLSGALSWSGYYITPRAWAMQLVGIYTDHSGHGTNIDDNKILLPYPTSATDPTPVPLEEEVLTTEEIKAIAKEVRNELTSVNDVNRGQKFPNGKMHGDDEGDTIGDVMYQLTSDDPGTARRALNDIYRHTPGLPADA